jgi:integrase
MADRTLAYLRAALNWYAVRTDDFRPPFARGMTRATGRERTRVLSDLELRRIWLHTEEQGPFERFVRVTLLTGQRRSEVARMAWTEIELTPSGMLWRIPRERFKSGMEHVLPLPDSIAPLLGEHGKLGPYVFSHDSGLSPINAFGRPLARLRTRSSTHGWVLHDLRRTCRTRLAGLGVADPVADLILGHGKRGLARVYNQHRYEGEMRVAFDAWAEGMRAILKRSKREVN